MTSSRQSAKILLVDDHPLVREGLSARISAQPDMHVCGEADDVAEGLASFVDKNPELTIVDLSLKTGHGLDLIKQIVGPRAPSQDPGHFQPTTKRCTRNEPCVPEARWATSARKNAAKSAVIDAIRTGARRAGQLHWSPAMTQAAWWARADRRAATRPPPRRSKSSADRELQVFQLIGQGLSSGVIAKQLHLSSHTIDTHREKIKLKLNLKSGAELTQQAVQWVLENR